MVIIPLLSYFLTLRILATAFMLPNFNSRGKLRDYHISTSLQLTIEKLGNSINGPNGEDIVWEALRKDAAIEAANEPLLASFMHAAILSHSSLEKSLAFHMANQLESSTMISTQVFLVLLFRLFIMIVI